MQTKPELKLSATSTGHLGCRRGSTLHKTSGYVPSPLHCPSSCTFFGFVEVRLWVSFTVLEPHRRFGRNLDAQTREDLLYQLAGLCTTLLREHRGAATPGRGPPNLNFDGPRRAAAPHIEYGWAGPAHQLILIVRKYSANVIHQVARFAETCSARRGLVIPNSEGFHSRVTIHEKYMCFT